MRRLLCTLLFTLPLFADPKIEQLRFMAGHWSAGGVEEVWLAPEGGLMTGMNRTIGKSGRASFEFFRIATTPEGITYFAQPGGKAATPFQLIEVNDDRAVFANPAHDFPKRLIYALRDGKLCARVEGDNGEGEEWCWSRLTSQ
ncbi:MAG TPA: DUF6265 family protein [Thermoanaerobaculia bacterium]|nr:DUF6265 family protein [Thermoanaerobaculia bacterium]